MIYLDRNSIKIKNRWQSRPNADKYAGEIKRKKKAFKKQFNIFSSLLGLSIHKIWWMSLDDDIKETVFSSYLMRIPIFDQFCEIDNDQIEELKPMYSPNPIIKRDLTIDEILK